MAENDSVTGLAITIPEEVFTDLNRLEKKIMGLGTITNNISGNIVASFLKMANGVDPFIKKVGEAEVAIERLGSIGFSSGSTASTTSIEKTTSAIVETANALNRTDFSANIENAHKRLQTLIGDLKIYEEYLNTPNDANQAFAAEGIEQTSKEIREIIAVIPELEKLQSVLSRNDLFQNYIDGLNGATIEARRQKSEMSQLNEYYRELEKLSAQAAKAQERASNQAAKAQERQRKEQEKLLAAQQKAYRETPKGAMDFAASATTYNQRAQAMKYLEAAIKNLDKTSNGYQQTLLRISSRYKTLKAEQDAVQRSMSTLQQSQHNLMDISGQLMRRLALVFSVSQVTQYVQKLAQVRGEFELQNAALTAIMQNKDEADQLFGQITQLAVQSPFQLKELVKYTKELAAYRIENEKLYDTTKMLADVSAGLGVDMSRLILAYGQVKAANYLRGTELRQFSEAGINILGELATYFSEIEGRAVSVGEVFEMVSNRMVTFQDVEEIFRRITSEGGIFANMQEVQSRTLAGMISNMQDAVDVMLNEIGIASEDILKGSVSAVGDLVRNWREVAFMMKEAAIVIGPIAGYFGLARIASSKLGNALFTIATKIPLASKAMESFMAATLQAQQQSLIAGRAMQGLGNILGGLATLGVTAAISAITIALMNLFRTATKAGREAKRLREEISGILSTDVTNINNSVVMYGELVEKLGQVNRGSGEHRDLIAQINSQYGEYLGYIVDETTSYEQLKDSIDSVTESMMKRSQMAAREKGLQAIYESTANDINKSQAELRETLLTSILSGLDRNATEKEINSIFGLFEKRVKETGGVIGSALEFRKILSEFYGKDVSVGLSNTGMLINYSKALLRQKEGELYLQNQLNDAYGEQYDTVEALNAIEANNDAREKALEAIHGQTELTKWEQKQRENAVNQQYDLQEIDLKVQYNVLTPEEGERQKQKLLNWATQTVEDVNDQVIKNLTSKGFSDELISRFLITPDMLSTGMPEIEKTVIASYQQATESIEQFNRLKAAGNRIDEQQLQNVINQQKGWYAVAEALGIVDELNKKGAKSALSKINKQIDVIKKAGKAYDEARKNLNTEAATEKIRKDYADVFSEAGIGDLIGTMSFDAEGIIAALLSLIDAASKKAGRAGRFAVEKAIAEARSDIGVLQIEINRQKLQDEIDDVFADYELSLGFKEMGGTEAMADLLGFDYTDLDDLGEKVREVISKLYSSGSTEDIKAAKKIQKKYDKIVLKDLRENTKKYLEYLNESKNERLKIEEDYQRRLAELQKTQLTDQQKQQATKNLTRERDQKLAEYDWNQFRDTDLYRNAFEDLERVGTRTLDILIRRLEEFAKANASAMSTEDFREYMNTLKQVRTELESRKPWKTLVNYVRQYKKATKNLRNAKKGVKVAQSEVDFYTQERDTAQKDVDSAQQDYDKAQSIEERIAALERLVAAQSQLETANSALSVSMDNLKEAEDKVTSAENSQQEAASGLSNKLSDISSDYNTMVNTINGVIDAVLELAESLGIAIDDETSAAIEGFQKGFSVLGTIMSTLIPIITAITVGGYAMQTALWPLLVIGAALGAVMAIVAALDAERQAIIDAEQEKIDALSESYDELAESLDQMTSTKDLQRYSQELQKNVEQQVDSYDKMIAAEQSRKNPDEEQIAEWEKAQEDLLKQSSEDLEAALVEAGGVAKDDYLSTAEDFVNAWVEAFKETGDGLSGLKDNFDEFFQNVLISQAALDISKKFIDPLIDDLNEKIGDNFELTDTEKQEWYNNVKAAIPGLNAALEAILGPWIEQAKDEEGSLSGLQKGIQGVTEETAQIIEALLNSMRYYVADTNAKLNSIYLMLSGTEGVPNPMLVELRAQTEQLRAINRLIRNVTASGHPNGGDGIKIFMN